MLLNKNDINWNIISFLGLVEIGLKCDYCILILGFFEVGVRSLKVAGAGNKLWFLFFFFCEGIGR